MTGSEENKSIGLVFTGCADFGGGVSPANILLLLLLLLPNAGEDEGGDAGDAEDMLEKKSVDDVVDDVDDDVILLSVLLSPPNRSPPDKGEEIEEEEIEEEFDVGVDEGTFKESPENIPLGGFEVYTEASGAAEDAERTEERSTVEGDETDDEDEDEETEEVMEENVVGRDEVVVGKAEEGDDVDLIGLMKSSDGIAPSVGFGCVLATRSLKDSDSFVGRVAG